MTEIQQDTLQANSSDDSLILAHVVSLSPLHCRLQIFFAVIRLDFGLFCRYFVMASVTSSIHHIQMIRTAMSRIGKKDLANWQITVNDNNSNWVNTFVDVISRFLMPNIHITMCTFNQRISIEHWWVLKPIWPAYFRLCMPMKSGMMSSAGNPFLVSSRKMLMIQIEFEDIFPTYVCTFAVHTMPWPTDHLLTTGKHSPLYEFALKKNMDESPEVQRIYAEHADLFSSLSENSGAKISTIADVFKLYDTLKVEKDHSKLYVNFWHFLSKSNLD